MTELNKLNILAGICEIEKAYLIANSNNEQTFHFKEEQLSFLNKYIFDEKEISYEETEKYICTKLVFHLKIFKYQSQISKIKKTIEKKSNINKKNVNDQIKKKRLIFSSDQRNLLEEYFLENAYPKLDERVKLAEKLGIDTRRVQVWFQNKRQKQRKLNLNNSN